MNPTHAEQQAQLAAFLLATSPPQSSPASTPSPFDPVQALAALQWGAPGHSQVQHDSNDDLDGWLEHQLNQLEQLGGGGGSDFSLGPPPPAPPHRAPPRSVHVEPEFELAQAPAQPHAFPPISSSRFHPYDRHPQKPHHQHHQHHQHQQPHQQQQPQQRWHHQHPLTTTTKRAILYPPEYSPSPVVIVSASPSPLAHHLQHPPAAEPLVVDTRQRPPPPPRQLTSSFARTKRRTRSLPNLSIVTGDEDDDDDEEETRRRDTLESLFDWLDDQRWNVSTLLTALSDVAPPPDTDTATEDPGLRRRRRRRQSDTVGDPSPTHRRRLQEFLNLDRRRPPPPRRRDGFVVEGEEDEGEETEGDVDVLEVKIKKWKAQQREKRMSLEGGGGGGATRRRGELRGSDSQEENGPREIVDMWERLGRRYSSSSSSPSKKPREVATTTTTSNRRRNEPNLVFESTNLSTSFVDEQTREQGMREAMKELHFTGGQTGPTPGVAIRSVINRYHEAYNGSQADIARLDAALSRPPSPHLSSAPREPLAWSGHLVVARVQADLLSHWLMSPGRPNLQHEREKGSIEADHMRIYSSLSPLDLHARGAEICRAILTRDGSTRSLFGQHWDSIHSFVEGPLIAPLDTAGFSHYDDYSLWHHSLMCYLQLCVRYPAFQESKEAHLDISPDLPPPIEPTRLELSLMDRLLKSHWDYLRLYLLNEHGGLLRSAVRGFEGVKLTRFDLLSVVGDTIEVIEALKKSRNSSDRILPYDASVSQVRNAWRQRAFWDPQASWVAWSAATTHFLELSALNKEWALGVKDLPGIEGLLGGSSSKTAAAQALR
ncbi:hypothetical protein JCM3766R1_005289 [Sporobolomyces carnicolor]